MAGWINNCCCFLLSNVRPSSKEEVRWFTPLLIYQHLWKYQWISCHLILSFIFVHCISFFAPSKNVKPDIKQAAASIRLSGVLTSNMSHSPSQPPAEVCLYVLCFSWWGVWPRCRKPLLIKPRDAGHGQYRCYGFIHILSLYRSVYIHTFSQCWMIDVWWIKGHSCDWAVKVEVEKVLTNYSILQVVCPK